MTEFELIERYFTRAPRDRSVHLGVGDDAALLAPTPDHELVASVDMLVAGRHFLAAADPERLGHKALAVNLSDMAAMGARPRWALLAGALPEADPDWIAPFARGFFALAHAYEVDVVGGDTTRGPLNLCVTVLGEVPSGTALVRSAARVGDDIHVTGTLGDAALAVHLAAASPGAPGVIIDAALLDRLDRPQPRVAVGIALRGVANAALDISDGLVGDLGHILARSGVGARVELARIPRAHQLDERLRGQDRALALRCILAGGDDYELCFTAPAHVRERVSAIGRQTGVAITRIGTIEPGRELVIVDERGERVRAVPDAFDHFATP